MTKICSGCGEEKPVEAGFHRNASSPDGRRSTCKTCQNRRTKSWRDANPERMRELKNNWYQEHPGHATDYQRARRHERRDVFDAMKRAQGCADCQTSEGDLHFDHRPGVEKLFNIADGYARDWDKILAEIAKCDVRCAACHARRHHSKQGEVLS